MAHFLKNHQNLHKSLVIMAVILGFTGIVAGGIHGYQRSQVAGTSMQIVVKRVEITDAFETATYKVQVGVKYDILLGRYGWEEIVPISRAASVQNGELLQDITPWTSSPWTITSSTECSFKTTLAFRLRQQLTYQDSNELECGNKKVEIPVNPSTFLKNEWQNFTLHAGKFGGEIEITYKWISVSGD